MPVRMDEGPPVQWDRVTEPDQEPLEELRSIETEGAGKVVDPDTRAPMTDDQNINTHGSER